MIVCLGEGGNRSDCQASLEATSSQVASLYITREMWLKPAAAAAPQMRTVSLADNRHLRNCSLLSAVSCGSALTMMSVAFIFVANERLPSPIEMMRDFDGNASSSCKELEDSISNIELFLGGAARSNAGVQALLRARAGPPKVEGEQDAANGPKKSTG